MLWMIEVLNPWFEWKIIDCCASASFSLPYASANGPLSLLAESIR